MFVYHFQCLYRNQTTEIFSRTLKHYGNTNRLICNKWTVQYRFRINVSDSQRFGNPEEVTSAVTENQIEKSIQEYGRITVGRIAVICNRSVGTVHSIIHDKLKYRKTCAHWVPKRWTDHYKTVTAMPAHEMLSKYSKPSKVGTRNSYATIHTVRSGPISF